MKTHFLSVVAIAAALTATMAANAPGANFNNKVLRVPSSGLLKQLPGTPAPLYRFTIVSFTIDDTRALHNDTDYVTGGLTGQPNQVKDMGDVNNGTHNIGMVFNAAVADGSSVTFSYVILNSGKPAGSIANFGENFVFNVGLLFNDTWFGVLAGGCDGMVAQGQHVFTGSQLASETANGVLSGNDYTSGSDSPAGCGSNSRYHVKWSVSAVH